MCNARVYPPMPDAFLLWIYNELLIPQVEAEIARDGLEVFTARIEREAELAARKKVSAPSCPGSHPHECGVERGS